MHETCQEEKKENFNIPGTCLHVFLVPYRYCKARITANVYLFHSIFIIKCFLMFPPPKSVIYDNINNASIKCDKKQQKCAVNTAFHQAHCNLEKIAHATS